MPENDDKRIPLTVAFSQALGHSLTESSSFSWKADVSDNPNASAPDTESTAYYRFRLSGAVTGDALVAVRHSDAIALGLRDTPEDTEEYEEEHSGALLAMFNQSAADLGGRLTEYGAVTVEVEAASAAELPEGAVIEILAETTDPERKVYLFLFVSPELLESMKIETAQPEPETVQSAPETAEQVQEMTMAAPEVTTPAPKITAPASETTTPASEIGVSHPEMKTAAPEPVVAATPQANLNLVMDVELNVTLRFGQRRLSLREVLDLTSGSVVELDRQVDEPVELVIDGRVVARGDAVIIDGNYGLRVTQVVQPFVA